MNNWSVNQEPVLTDGLLMCLFAWHSLARNNSEALINPDVQSVNAFLGWLLLEMPMEKPETEEEKEFIRLIRRAIIT